MTVEKLVFTKVSLYWITTSFAIIRQYSYVSYQIRFLFISGIVERPSSSKPRPPRECQLHEPRNEAANIVHRSHTAHQLSRIRLSSKQGLHPSCVAIRGGRKVTPAKTHYPINNQQGRTQRVHECPHQYVDVSSAQIQNVLVLYRNMYAWAKEWVRALNLIGSWIGTSVCHLMQAKYVLRWMSVKLVHVSNRTLMQMVNVTRELTLYCSTSVQLAQCQL